MNDFFKNLFSKIGDTWNKWTKVQKGIFVSIVLLVLVSIILISVLSARPDKIAIFNSSIKDQVIFDRIVTRLEKENVKFQVTADNRIYVDSDKVAKKLKGILIQEDLMPKNLSPWEFLNVNKFYITDVETKEKIRLALAKSIEQHLEAINDIDDAKVEIAIPKEEYFKDQESPVTASIILTLRPGSDFIQSKKRIQGVEKLILMSIPEIKKDNIVITDNAGRILSGDMDAAFDKLQLTESQLKIKQKAEKLLYEKVKQVLMNGGAGGPIPKNRISISPVEIDMQFDEESYIYDEILPIILLADNPDTPYDDSKIIEKVLVESVVNNEEYKGTGFNPEGPPGVEGQVPPAYKDLEGLVGKYSKDQAESRYDVNKKRSNVLKTPWQVKGISVSVLIDGIWTKAYDSKGNIIESEVGGIKREYSEVDAKTLSKIKGIVEGAINYNKHRGDIVKVENIKFDRSSQFELEDTSYRNSKKMRQIVLYSVFALLGLFILIVVVRAIIRFRQELQRKRDAELRRRAKDARAMALKDVEGLAVPISGADKKRQQIMEEALSMARDNPEDVAHLIRTWLVED